MHNLRSYIIVRNALDSSAMHHHTMYRNRRVECVNRLLHVIYMHTPAAERVSAGRLSSPEDAFDAVDGHP